MNVLQYIMNHPGIIWALLIFGVPVAGRIWKKLNDQARKRQEALRREQEEMERLRTGRGLSGPAGLVQSAAPPAQSQPQQPVSARATLEEMAARRRAQIEQLRQRRHGGAAPTPPTMQAPPVPQAPPISTRRTMPTQSAPRPAQVAESRLQVPPSARQAPLQRNRPAPARSAPPQRRQEQRVRQAPPTPRSRTPVMAAPPEQTIEAATARRIALAEQTTVPKPPAASAARQGWTLSSRPMSRADWRRAIIAKELLGPPRSMQ